MMATARPDRVESELPLRRFSVIKVPGIASAGENAVVQRPRILEGDPTAFAFILTEDSLTPVLKRGTVMYCTGQRDPGPGDIALFILKGGTGITRIVTDINENGYRAIRLKAPFNLGEKVAQIECIEEEILFDDLDEIVLVITNSRDEK